MAKVAIVTGSATGIGTACAVNLAARGWNATINYCRSKKEADETYTKIKAEGVEAIVVQSDIGPDEDCRKLAIERMGAHRWPY
ncbi:SDR family NAD(P)-dependent oxidoreductase [Mesorhizobium sp. VK25A]|uniref:SDR family NAD(P)-dependent oxidoreductase n=1 Tax=Mesorhizobium vachelliae TaxID=3072309 RepID=A0ABU5AEZ0_9HYPH|nr:MULTISPECIES: SDR family NAD(P)-dependent oxidoreductase [unclassified Mesorhizobium]MDX8535856.1 SDR family NAD(P)-dependent oxidoreductase [Mesorhizobium sp. VK25D]MDX8548601.1 SDR family NAD(P)-dependent oxidoreductase [Mesorhizobium sp. VK25A]